MFAWLICFLVFLCTFPYIVGGLVAFSPPLALGVPLTIFCGLGSWLFHLLTTD